jgi:hypothetical protein
MTRMTTKTIMASLVAATIGMAALSAPAAAGGSIAFTVAPTNAEEAQAMQAGLQIFALVNAVQNGGSITQLGMNNLAGLGQNGHGNLGIIHQDGNGHSGTLQQNGNGNSYGIFQFGENTNANVAQNGNGQTGATFVFGW